MAGRKLYIIDEGLDMYVDKVYATVNDMRNPDFNFADKIACREYVLNQLKLASNLPKIQSISVAQEGDIRFKTRDLFITTTDCERTRKFYVGDWRVSVTYEGSFAFKSQKKQSLGFHSPVWGANTVHPHISGRTSHGCLGNAEAPLQYYLKTGNVKALAIYILGYLESVNLQDSAGITLGYCKEVELDEENNPIVTEDGTYKYKSNEFDREDSYSINRRSSDVVDRTHKEYLTYKAVRCHQCSEYYNPLWVIYQDNCRAYCKECSENLKQCKICGALIDYADNKIGDDYYCKECTRNYLKTCSTCNKLFKPDGDASVDMIKGIEYLSDFNVGHTVAMKTANEGIEYRCMCDECKARLPQEFKDKYIVDFKKLKLYNSDNKMVSLKSTIDYGEFNSKCTSCGTVLPVEHLSSLPAYKSVKQNAIYRSQCVCGKCLGSEDLNADREQKHTERWIRKIIMSGSANKVSTAIDIPSATGKLVITKNPRLPGIIYPRRLFNNYMEEITQVHNFKLDCEPIEECKICASCSLPIENEEPLYDAQLDKYFHITCASNTYVKCPKCTHLIPLNKTVAGNLKEYTKDEAHMCMNCYNNREEE